MALELGSILEFDHIEFGKLSFVIIDSTQINDLTVYTFASMKPITERRYSDKGCHWSKSEIREWLNGEFLEGFSIKDNIIPVEKLTGKRGMKNITELTDDKIWLFSEHEVGATFARGWDVDEGKNYPYINNSETLKVMTEEEHPSFILRSPSVYIQGDEVLCVKDGAIELVKMTEEMPIMIGFCAF